MIWYSRLAVVVILDFWTNWFGAHPRELKIYKSGKFCVKWIFLILNLKIKSSEFNFFFKGKRIFSAFLLLFGDEKNDKIVIKASLPELF